jgi:guanylate kinase
MTAPRGMLYVISAPSGAGKSTLVTRLIDAEPDLAFSVSWTTRPPRPGEVDGVAYHFTDTNDFRARMAAGEFLEWAEVHGKFYGTSRADTERVLASGRDLLLDIDVQGAEQVRSKGLEMLSIFVLPPDRQTLVERLRARGTETPVSLERRIADASREVARWEEFDYVIINGDLEPAAGELIAIVRAVRASRKRRAVEARRIAQGFVGP